MASSSSLSLLLSSPPLSRTWEHNVFPSFHGPCVRKGLLSHLREKCRSKGIGLFIDNEIKRGESIGPELKRAIRGSQVAIVLLSRNYASSSWCLDELVEIMECRDLGRTVMTIFYDVEPTDVMKQTGYFGEVFRKTCQGKTEEKSETWRKALEGVATIAGYDLKNWDDEATMIETIATDISNKLNMSTLSCGFERYIGMRAHIEKMKPLLRMDLDEVRMIGIWGPPGIGKTTIAKFLFNKLSNSFQLRANMETIKVNYPHPCLNEHKAQVQLHNQMLSQMFHEKDMAITHLGVAEQRLKDKKVLLILDDVDQVEQLDALAKETWWFGPGSRIIIITQDVRVLTAHGINHIYTVDLPSNNEALKMFCMYAFGQKHPKDGFRELAWKVVCYAGKLPLGIKVLGSYFRNMSMQEWEKALPKVWRSLDGKIKSILKFSYDALDDEEKALFLHIACLFANDEEHTQVDEYLVKRFPCVSQGLDILAEKSLISLQNYQVQMHDLLAQLGREIVRKQSPNEPGKRQFLVDNDEISEILVGDATSTKKVIGINYVNFDEGELNISERAFEGMSNLQFLKIKGYRHTLHLQFLKEEEDTLHLPHGLRYLSPKLRLLHWKYFPMKCLPSNVTLKYLVELNMTFSKLEKLWEGIKCLPNLKWMYLSDSKYLKELPDLSTATNLKILDLSGCSSLVELPSSIGIGANLQDLNLKRCRSLVRLPSSIGYFIMSQRHLIFTGCSSLLQIPSTIGNATKIEHLNFSGCSSLVELPSYIGNATNIERLDFSGCSSLVELPASIGNLHKLHHLILKGCSKLEVLPVNVNLKSLNLLDLRGCSSLKQFPEISTNIKLLYLDRTAIEEVPSSIRSWSRLERLDMINCKNLNAFTQAFDTKIQEIYPLVQGFPRLRGPALNGCKDSCNFESLERLDCSFQNPKILLNFGNCFKLNKEARDLIIQTSARAVLPGKEIPTYFSYRANGGSLIVNLKERTFPSSLKFKVCILLVSENEVEDGDSDVHNLIYVDYKILDKQNSLNVRCTGGEHDKMSGPLTNHLYIYKLEADVTSNELFFEFTINRLYSKISDKWVIKECGVHCENCEAKEEVNEGDSAGTKKRKMVSQFSEDDSAETKKRKMDQMETDTSVIIGTISKYTSNSEAGCSTPKLFDFFH